MEIYLDNAATSHPKPESVRESVVRALTQDNANPGRSGHARAIRAAETVLRAREAVAGLLGARDPFRVVFCFNCTDALNLAIKGCLTKGDHAICSSLEHNSVLRVLSGLKQAGEIELTILSPTREGAIDPVSVVMALRANTKLIALTHASNVTGAVQPVAAVGRIARANGVTYLIDGAQALGALHVDVEALGCDLYAFPGHKSLLGPQGTGGLYIRKGLRLKTLREGGTGSSSESMLQPEEMPERYEAGTLNLPGLAGLCAGASYARAHLDEIQAAERRVSAALYEDLFRIPGVTVYSPPDARSRTGVVSFNIADLPSAQVADALSQAQICVRAGLHCAPGAHAHLGTLKRGAVRASVGYMNGEADVEALIRAVRAIAKRAGPA